MNEDPSPEAQPADMAEMIERNRAMLGDFFAKRAIYELQPTVERHADAVVLPSLRVAVLREPAIGVEYGIRDRNARVVDGGAYTAEGEIIRSALHRSGGLRFHMPRPDLAVALEACGPAGDDPVVEEGRWIYGGFLYGHFGHFLMESLGRLWALDRLRDWADGICWILPVPPRRNAAAFGDAVLKKRFIQDTLRLLGVDKELRVITRPTVFQRLAVPSLLMLNGPDSVAAGHPVFRRFIRRIAEDQAEPPTLPGLYVSRAALVGNGRFAEEERLEEAFAQAGWQVLRPETKSVPEQVALYRSARQLVFAEGSALHLYAYAARPRQRVGIILRRLPAKMKFPNQLHGFNVAEVHVADAIAGILLPDEQEAEEDRDPTYWNKAEIVLDHQHLGDWLVAHGFLDAAQRAEAWAWLDATPLPPEAPEGAMFGPGMVPRARLVQASAAEGEAQGDDQASTAGAP